MQKCLQITISGDIYDKGFRSSAMYIAYIHNLKGYVMYIRPHDVYIEAEGEERDLNSFVLWCKSDSVSSALLQVSISESELKGFSSFIMVVLMEK